MGINLLEEHLKWNDKKIVKYEKLLGITNKSTLRNKYMKKLENHMSAKDNYFELLQLVAEDLSCEFSKHLKKEGYIKRLK